MSLNYVTLVSQRTKYSIIFIPFLNLLETKALDFFTFSNIHYLELFHRSLEARDSSCWLYKHLNLG